MSRSFKKNPFEKEYRRNGGTRKIKRLASKRVRREEKVSDYGSYKKVFDSWNISDYTYGAENNRK